MQCLIVDLLEHLSAQRNSAVQRLLAQEGRTAPITCVRVGAHTLVILTDYFEENGQNRKKQIECAMKREGLVGAPQHDEWHGIVTHTGGQRPFTLSPLDGYPSFSARDQAAIVNALTFHAQKKR